MAVLFQSAIAHLDEAEHALDDADGVLDLRTHLRLGPVLRALDLVDHAAMAIAAVDEVLGLRRVLTDRRCLTPVCLVAPDAGLIAMQQVR